MTNKNTTKCKVMNITGEELWFSNGLRYSPDEEAQAFYKDIFDKHITIGTEVIDKKYPNDEILAHQIIVTLSTELISYLSELNDNYDVVMVPKRLYDLLIQTPAWKHLKNFYTYLPYSGIVVDLKQLVR